jgi:prepilin signal peptidase PulO-like enzyme (type II secretory pathway)
MNLLPDYFVLSVVFVFGLIIGSFLDVLVCRFHTGKSINGRSRCMSCGHQLSWYELFPLLSYIVLRGRCLSCGAHIPARLFLMEIATALIFLYVYFQSETLLECVLGIILCSLLIVIAAYDIRHMVIPHEFVFILGALSVILVGVESGFRFQIDLLLLHLLAAFLIPAFFGALWFISKGKWIGLGDAKLAFPLAFMLTPILAFSMLVLSFWIGAVVSIVLLLVQRALLSGQHHLPFMHVPLTMKSEVPFAPFLIAAFVLVYFQDIEVLTLLSNMF